MNEIGKIGDEILCRYLKKAGLINDNSEIRRYLNHGICHFIGLDAHDVGDFCELKPGMALTVEPGLYIPEQNIAIRLEDSVVVTDKGIENLTVGLGILPKDIECEWS